MSTLSHCAVTGAGQRTPCRHSVITDVYNDSTCPVTGVRQTDDTYLADTGVITDVHVDTTCPVTGTGQTEGEAFVARRTLATARPTVALSTQAVSRVLQDRVGNRVGKIREKLKVS